MVITLWVILVVAALISSIYLFIQYLSQPITTISRRKRVLFLASQLFILASLVSVNVLMFLAFSKPVIDTYTNTQAYINDGRNDAFVFVVTELMDQAQQCDGDDRCQAQVSR